MEDYFRQPKDERVRDFRFRYANEIRVLKKYLASVFEYKCAFCEVLIGEEKFQGIGELSLFRPIQDAHQLDGSTDPDHYWWLSWDWSNMYFSCYDCNQNKASKFPTKYRRAEPGVRGTMLQEEGPLLLDPCQDDPHKHLRFSETGQVSPRSERGTASIETFDLNRDELVESRRGNVNQLRELYANTPAEEWSSLLVTEAVSNREFSGMRIQMLDRWLQEGCNYKPSRPVNLPQQPPRQDGLLGQMLGNRYVIDRLIGEGGMASVYLAHDTNLNRQVAVKVMLDSCLRQKAFLIRFEREVDFLKQIVHPHIITAEFRGIIADKPYFVLQYMAGGTLQDRMQSRQDRMTLEEVLEWLPSIAKALDYIHSDKKVIHRDVKPSNILFDEKGHPYLSDFGILKRLDEGARGLTQCGYSLGTPAYMPNDVEDTPAYDQYSLAKIVGEALKGYLHTTNNVNAKSMRRQFSRVLDHASSIDPTNRFRSCTEFVESLKGCI